MIKLHRETGEGWYIPPADATRYGATRAAAARTTLASGTVTDPKSVTELRLEAATYS